jgi:hypothetical protein
VLAKTAGIAGMIGCLITGEIKMLKNLREGWTAWMPKSFMPQRDGRCSGGSEAVVLWWTKRVEIAGAVTSENLLLGWQILDREAMGVKFNRDIIITS